MMASEHAVQLARGPWDEAALLAERPGCLGHMLPDDLVVPRYDGRGIANVAATIGALLRLPVGPLPPVEAGAWQPLADGGVERVVLLVVDALGYRSLAHGLAADAEGAAWLAERGARLTPLTAVFPSTTAATITSLWTGADPARHGILGYRMWLREAGVVANMIALRSARKALDVDLVRAGLVHPKSFVPGYTLGQQLTMKGAAVNVLIDNGILDSGLSRIVFQGTTRAIGFAGLGDSLVQLRRALEDTARRRCLVMAYWDDLDRLGHLRGANDEGACVAWSLLFHGLRQHVFDQLSVRARRKTVVLLVADHGMASAGLDGVVALDQHPELAQCLALPPSGEARAAMLHLRPGAAADARAYAEATLNDAFVALDAAEALEAGLWGPGPAHPEARHRTGDLVLLARGEHTLVEEQPKIFRTLGRHGSLTPDEALVPLLGFRLD